MRYLKAEDILNIHSVIIDETGGTHGVRERDALAGLEGLPQQAAYGQELYEGLFLKAAVYVRNLIFGHPFIDGNKRTAMACADVFLELNGYRITVKKGGVEQFAFAVIKERHSLETIAAWLEDNSTAITP